MPYHDCSLKTITIPDDRGIINTIWGVAIGDSLLTYYCNFCNIIFKANFPRQKMEGRTVQDAKLFQCPGCVKMILKKVES